MTALKTLAHEEGAARPTRGHIGADRDDLIRATALAVEGGGPALVDAVATAKAPLADRVHVLLRVTQDWAGEGDLAWARIALDAAIALDPRAEGDATALDLLGRTHDEESAADWVHRVVRRCVNQGDGGFYGDDDDIVDAFDVRLTRVSATVTTAVVSSTNWRVEPRVLDCLRRGPHPGAEAADLDEVHAHVQLRDQGW